MSQYLVPTDKEFIEHIAKAIAKNRMFEDADSALQNIYGLKVDLLNNIDDIMDGLFETMWNGNSENDEHQRQHYRTDARAAINAINLKLITTGI